MVRAFRHYRLTQADVDALTGAIRALDAAHDAVDHTGVPTKPAIKELLVNAYRAIETVLAGERALFERWSAEREHEAAAGSPPPGEASAQEPVSGPRGKTRK